MKLLHSSPHCTELFSEMEGRWKGVCVRESFSPVRISVLICVSVCGPICPLVLHTLMILCLLLLFLHVMVFIDYICVTNPWGCFGDYFFLVQ